MVDRLARVVGFCRSPTVPHLGLVTYDAKDPDTAFPPIEPLLPPEGAPNVLIVLLDDVGIRGRQRLRRAGADADGRAAAARRADLHPVPYDRAVRARPARRC